MFRQSRREGEISNNKMESENTLHVSHSSINSLLSDTTYNDVVQTEMIASFSINSKSQNQKCDKHSKCHSNTVLENSKTLTKKAAIEAVSAIIPHESDNIPMTISLLFLGNCNMI